MQVDIGKSQVDKGPKRSKSYIWGRGAPPNVGFGTFQALINLTFPYINLHIPQVDLPISTCIILVNLP